MTRDRKAPHSGNPHRSNDPGRISSTQKAGKQPPVDADITDELDFDDDDEWEGVSYGRMKDSGSGSGSGSGAEAGTPGAGPSTYHLSVSKEAIGARLDKFLADELLSKGLTRSRLQALIDEGQVILNGQTALTSKKVGANTRLKGGEQVEIRVPAPKASELIPEDIPLDVLYEDGWLLVLNKPAGMVVHPARGAEEGTLVHALLFRIQDLSGIGGEERPGIVHRLDKDTSGVLVVAKCDAAHRHLSQQFKIHSITRRYRALVKGTPPEQGTWRSNLGRNPNNRLKMRSLQYGGRPSVTHFQVLERFPGASLVEFTLETGRTHQIRVHTSEAGFPILCDEVYGGHWERGLPEDKTLHSALKAANRQLLHALQLTFEHPEDGRTMAFVTELPPDFQQVLDAFRQINERLGASAFTGLGQVSGEDGTMADPSQPVQADDASSVAAINAHILPGRTAGAQSQNQPQGRPRKAWDPLSGD